MPSSAAVLLDELSSLVSRFVVLTPAQADTCALFVLHTHTFAAARFTPYLHITSAEPRSGKTLLLQVLRSLVAKPRFTAYVSVAALARLIEAERPTLLLDEVDAAFSLRTEYAEQMRGLLNAGYSLASGSRMVCDKTEKGMSVKEFRVFCPKVVAGIGQLPHTIQDRSLPIWLKRARKEDVREPFYESRLETTLNGLRKRCVEWSVGATEGLKQANPQFPASMGDRKADCCSALLAIADHAGGDWPERGRKALVGLSIPPLHDESDGLQLLYHIRDLFEESRAERFASVDLVTLLNSREEWPWGEYDNGRPLTPIKLAKLLRPLSIGPRPLRFDELVVKGYRREEFEDAWNRYARGL